MNLANRSYAEKRNFIRMRVDIPVDVKLAPDVKSLPVEVKLGQQRQWAGKCHNLSGGGMLISVPEPLPLGVELEVTVSSHHGHSPMLKALTKVCRVNSPTPHECRLGLEILTLLE
jgi:hypothetical protein